MYWIRFQNAGSLCISQAFTVLGLSEKTTDNAIGHFGSGAKYAMAQMARNGIQIKVVTNDEIYTLGVDIKRGRNTEYGQCFLKQSSGKKHMMPFATSFGQDDWTDLWFPFREFYSNMKDENGTMDLVQGVPEPNPDTVQILIPYDTFKKYHDNVGEYFPNISDNQTVKPGNGFCYVKGVYAGISERIAKLGINLYSEDQNLLTETRTLKEDYAFAYVVNQFKYYGYDIESDDAIYNFVMGCSSTGDTYNTLYIDPAKRIHKALVNKVGENYSLVKTDAEMDLAISRGARPVFVGTFFNFPANLFGHIQVECLNNLSASERSFTAEEEAKFNRVLKMVSWLEPQRTITYRAMKHDTAVGTADIANGVICIKETLLTPDADDNELARVLIHEIGHIESRAADEQRAFTDWFVRKLAAVSM